MKDFISTKFVSPSPSSKALLLCLAMVFGGCSKQNTQSINRGSLPTERPPAQVDVVKVLSESVSEYRVFTGRTAAAHSVEVRPRVGGYLVQAPNNLDLQISKSFGIPSHSELRYLTASSKIPTPHQPESARFAVSAREGDRVEAGTPLFQIDPRPFELTLHQARGNLEALIAQRQRFSNELDRLRKLLETNSISESEFELARANLEESAGQKDALEAAVRRAELDLEFTQIRAPITGIIGRTLVTPANVVSADSTVLTTIVSIDPVHVFFDIDEDSFLRFRSFLKELANQSTQATTVPVSLSLSNESGFPHKGKIDFQNNTTDPGSGNTLLRAEFANAAGALSPGLFCRVSVPFSTPKPRLLVPTKCLAMDQQGKFVMQVDPNNIVTRRSVTTSGVQGAFTIIESGLEEGDTVIYEGLQRVRPSDRVSPNPSSAAPSFFDPAKVDHK